MNIERTAEEFRRLRFAVENFSDTVGTAQTFGPEALPGHMACSEANVFSELLDALGMPEEASSLRRWHLYEESTFEKDAFHSNWTEEAPSDE